MKAEADMDLRGEGGVRGFEDPHPQYSVSCFGQPCRNFALNQNLYRKIERGGKSRAHRTDDHISTGQIHSGHRGCEPYLKSSMDDALPVVSLAGIAPVGMERVVVARELREIYDI